MEVKKQSGGARRRSRRQKNNGCAGTVVYVIAVLGISIILSIVAVFMANDVLALVKDDVDISITLTESTKMTDVAKQLDDSGIVKYGSLFKLYVNMAGKDAVVAPGSYLLNPSMDYTQIVRKLLSEADTDIVKLTIPEGYSTQQIVELLVENGVCSQSEAEEALNDYAFKHEFLESLLPPTQSWLEGYLFPDTYEMYANSEAVDAINKMLNNFEVKYDAAIQEGAAELGLSMNEVVIIASLIEKEAQVDEEYSKIAGVIYNRLNNSSSFPYLQIDASVYYGLGRTSGDLTQEDLDTDTPYNLYTREGLPPTAICNPGYKSLYAATHPDSHNYYYYVAMPDGSHLFANSNSEHNQNIATASAAFAAQS